MASSSAAKPDACPACGARITRPELSLCSYCATPLSVGGPARAADEATLQRLARMPEHKDFAEASSWEPTDADDAPGAARRLRRARWLCGAGLLVVLLGGVALATPAATRRAAIATLLAGAAAAIAAALTGSRARALLSRVRNQPLLRRPAIVIDRRSVTTPAGLGSRTIYFFTLQFADGSAGEYSFLGRGAHYELPAAGSTGLACTRGARLLEFLRLRV